MKKITRYIVILVMAIMMLPSCVKNDSSEADKNKTELVIKNENKALDETTESVAEFLGQGFWRLSLTFLSMLVIIISLHLLNILIVLIIKLWKKFMQQLPKLKNIIYLIMLKY